MIKYRDIENLPANHPLVKQFMEQIEAEENTVVNTGSNNSLENEESLEYFDRYIAGDR